MKMICGAVAASTAALLMAQPATAAERLDLTFVVNLGNGDAYGGEGELVIENPVDNGSDTVFTIVGASGSAKWLGGVGTPSTFKLGDYPDDMTVRLSGGVYSLMAVGFEFDFAPSYLALEFPVSATRIDGGAPDGVTAQFTYTLTPQVQSGVPEPATWAMLIAGFGLTGAAMRRRRVQVAFA